MLYQLNAYLPDTSVDFAGNSSPVLWVQYLLHTPNLEAALFTSVKQKNIVSVLYKQNLISVFT
jgi:hypothetical protein